MSPKGQRFYLAALIWRMIILMPNSLPSSCSCNYVLNKHRRGRNKALLALDNGPWRKNFVNHHVIQLANLLSLQIPEGWLSLLAFLWSKPLWAGEGIIPIEVKNPSMFIEVSVLTPLLQNDKELICFFKNLIMNPFTRPHNWTCPTDHLEWESGRKQKVIFIMTYQSKSFSS